MLAVVVGGGGGLKRGGAVWWAKGAVMQLPASCVAEPACCALSPPTVVSPRRQRCRCRPARSSTGRRGGSGGGIPGCSACPTLAAVWAPFENQESLNHQGGY